MISVVSGTNDIRPCFRSFPIPGGADNWFYVDNMNRKINRGLMLDRPEVTVNDGPQRQKIVDFMPEEGWLDYTWILQPPTDVSYGYGRMFRKENGVIYYKTVLIPNCLPEYDDFSPVPSGESQWLPAYVNEGIKL